MESLVIYLLGIILLLALVIVFLLARRGAQNRTLGEQINRVQTDLAELRVHAQTRQAENQSLAMSINHVQNGLTELRAYVKARQDLERQTMDSIRRLETVIAGTQTKGEAGENILEAVFSKLPPDWQVRNFTVDNRPVEFGLRLPNSLILPIDSKWTATPLLEQFVQSENPVEQGQLKKQIERAVLRKAREVKKYLDPRLTTSFGVAVVPDAVFDLSAGIQAEVFRLNVVLISYSLFVPYLLLVFQTVLKSSQSIDVQKLEAYLATVDESLDALQVELEGRFSRALRMLTNSGSEMRTHLSQVRGGLNSIQVSTRISPPAGDGNTPPQVLPEASPENAIES
jgi:DNA recombination protein RmuC